ncbi:LptF/LptG family permease [Aureivirga sp. CE67]|uniref:LptF/LptG family permease n=1 Tax=Aureivirga sp. CE67 TaxID=1788983 RepID=UPI0018CAFE5D|nr:LptF/LptG family permease [Aureivirga sp. CE67]
MKKLDQYILKSFLTPFFATFLIILFVLIMQAVWLYFDDLAGKGVNLIFILKFIWYLSLTLVPIAVPIAVLLSSIMALGNLSENYEFAAIKSVGISLKRMMAPLLIFTLALSALNFVFANNVFPYASFKQRNLLVNVKKKKPSLLLIPGTFNTEIPNFTIKFDERYGKNENMLRNVQIADLSKNRGKITVITAKNGEIVSKEGSRYMTIVLNDGYYYTDEIGHRTTLKEKNRLPNSRASFEKYTVNIDISDFGNEGLDKENISQAAVMLRLNQLEPKIDSLKQVYDKNIGLKLKNLLIRTKINELQPINDSLKVKGLSENVLENFNLEGQLIVLDNAISSMKRTNMNVKSTTSSFKLDRKRLNQYDFEFYHRVAFSLAPLILFFIGVPLGSIIRKGGFGVPMVLAIVVFVIYFFIDTFGKNLSEESALPASFASWLATIVLFPFGMFLTYKATKGMGVFDINNVIQPIKNFFNKLGLKKEKQHNNR